MEEVKRGRGRPVGSFVAEQSKQVRVPLGAEQLVKSLIDLYKAKGGAAAAGRFRRQLKISFGREVQEDLFK